MKRRSTELPIAVKRHFFWGGGGDFDQPGDSTHLADCLLAAVLVSTRVESYLASSSAFSRTACAMVSASWYFFLLLVRSLTESCNSA